VIRAIFFDFGGVLGWMDRDLMTAVETRYGLGVGGFLRTVIALPEWREAEVGRGSEEAFLEALDRRLHELGVPLPFGMQEAWKRAHQRLDEDVLSLIERLRGRYDVGLLSNATLSLDSFLRDYHRIDGLFKVIVNSSRVGMAKPDVRIYHLAAERMGVEPPACVHIDDDADNVEGARRAGFQGVHYDGDCAALERNLRSLGVEW
jgi:putative hydrolase of the HAD superfamily